MGCLWKEMRGGRPDGRCMISNEIEWEYTNAARDILQGQESLCGGRIKK